MHTWPTSLPQLAPLSLGASPHAGGRRAVCRQCHCPRTAAHASPHPPPGHMGDQSVACAIHQ
eukprot:406025-Pelagomonas_calceolata.AAC.5